jgi:hypothetical protein
MDERAGQAAIPSGQMQVDRGRGQGTPERKAVARPAFRRAVCSAIWPDGLGKSVAKKVSCLHFLRLIKNEINGLKNTRKT